MIQTRFGRELEAEYGGNAQGGQLKTDGFVIHALKPVIWYTSDPRTRKCDTNPKMGGAFVVPTQNCAELGT